MKTKMFLGCSLLAMSLAFVACEKSSDDSGSTTLKIRMTDAPLAVNQVNVDLEAVNVKFAKDTNAWVNMQVIPGIYNLLDYQNNIDTLIAQGTFPTGVLKEIRLVLGTDNTIMVDSVVHPLTIPSGAESGLKIKLNKNLAATIETVVIDFDAALSVSDEGGSWKLRPVIKIK